MCPPFKLRPGRFVDEGRGKDRPSFVSGRKGSRAADQIQPNPLGHLAREIGKGTDEALVYARFDF